MELIDFTEKNEKPIILALGYFDSVHNGHKKLLEECLNGEYLPAVFTFKNNPQSCISGECKQCYTFAERVEIFAKIGIKMVIRSEFDKNFMCLTGKEFLRTLVEKHNIKKVVFGKDYTCGVNAEYKQEDVKKFFEERNIPVKIVDLLMSGSDKIASRNIRNLLKNGKIEEVNSLLPYPYFLQGIVEKGRNVGSNVVGYPTANVTFPYDKIEIKAGVYKTNIYIDGKSYIGLSNVGAHPTFDDYNFNIESFVIGFCGNLYGKTIRIEFLRYLRGVKKFNNAMELKAQIDYDLTVVTGTDK